MPVRAPVGHAATGRGLAALGLPHGACSHPRTADGVATCHLLPHLAEPPGQRPGHAQPILMRSPIPTMEITHSELTNSVSRSRFFSTTLDPDKLDCTPPPNKLDSPPPRLRCSKISRISAMLVTRSKICRKSFITPSSDDD